MATTTISRPANFPYDPSTRQRVEGFILPEKDHLHLLTGIFATLTTVLAASASSNEVLIAIAVPLNTLLLILLALLSRHNGRKIDRNQITTVHAANAAASAAETAADAARITKEIGGMMRTTDPARTDSPPST